MNTALDIGGIYHATVTGRSTMVVITAVLPPCRQGDTGPSIYRVRNLQGTADDIEIRADAIKTRCTFMELATWFLEQKWVAQDIATYLDGYGVKYRFSTLSAYASNYHNYGSCFGPPSQKKADEDTKKSSHRSGSDRLGQLQSLVQTCGGVNQTHRCLTLIEQFGGLSEVRRFINLLAAN